MANRFLNTMHQELLEKLEKAKKETRDLEEEVAGLKGLIHNIHINTENIPVNMMAYKLDVVHLLTDLD